MARTLRAFGVQFEEVDVDSSAELASRYGERVPVLTDAAGAELCHARLDPALLAQIQ
jgi:thioredoxin reductase (NADPH)